jgi:carboxypeptidase Q
MSKFDPQSLSAAAANAIRSHNNAVKAAHSKSAPSSSLSNSMKASSLRSLLSTCSSILHSPSSSLIREDLTSLLAESNDHGSSVYHNLETLCICYPGRITGSKILDKALDWLRDLGNKVMKLPGCQEQIVEGVPQWVRGSADFEKLYVTINPPSEENTIHTTPIPYPADREMAVLATGMSVGTSEEGVSGALVIIYDYEQLTVLGQAGALEGKIVLFDWQHFVTYGALSGKYRNNGPIFASQYGAVASIIRSIAPDDSIGGLHTGSMYYQDGIKEIPAACLSIENTELLSRLSRRGYNLDAKLVLPCKLLEPKNSKNIIFELPGQSKDPYIAKQIVLIGGHTDSWECHHRGCQGAHDDGQGVIVCMEALHAITKYTRSKGGCERTIRVVLFVDEECRQTGELLFLIRYCCYYDNDECTNTSSASYSFDS